jgi:molybdopterin-containing oxidoreductase family membrane subunit
MIFCNVVSPQVFWFKACRQNPAWIFGVAFLVTIGMWFERFVIIVTSLHRAYLPGEWHMFFPTMVDILTFVGSCGTFLTLYLLFVRFLPQFAMSEIKAVLPQASPHWPGYGHGGHGGHGHGGHGGGAGHGSHAAHVPSPALSPDLPKGGA